MHQDIEQRLAQPVGGRPDAFDFGPASGRERNLPPTTRISAVSDVWAAGRPSGRGGAESSCRCGRAPCCVAPGRRFSREWRGWGCSGFSSSIGASKSAPASATICSPSCARSSRCFNFPHRAVVKIAELERPERDADQPVHLQPERFAAPCAPRGSCPRGCAKVSHTLAPCSRSSVASIGP